MARRTNYSFEKRQKELAKKKKKEEKRLRKQGKLNIEENETGETTTVENDTQQSTEENSPVE
ncbi:MAG: hypothetical protein ABFS18_13960 [Thermodesulfobacteriota bacterium]